MKNSVIEKYSDQVHFIYELFQVDHIANISKCETISCHTEPDVKYKCNGKDNVIEGKDKFKNHKKNGG